MSLPALPTESASQTTRRGPLIALLIGSAISQIGDAMALVALPWFVLQSTGSAALTGLAGAMTVLPALLTGLFGGVLVDRVGYWRTSLLADLVSGAAIAAIPLLHAMHALPFWLLLVLIFLGALLAVPGLTARRAMLPEIAALAGIARERVNAAFESVQYLAFLLGPPLAGGLIAVIGAPGVLWLDALTFAAAALLIGALVPRLAAPRHSGPWRYGAELRAGLGFLRRDRVLLALALSLSVTNFLGNPLFSVLLPVVVSVAGGRAADLGVMVAAQGGGALLGALLYGAFGPRLALPRRTIWITGYLTFALMLWVVVLQPPLPLLVGVLFLSGVAGGPLNPLSVTIRQERIPLELRGRVFSTFSALSMAAAPFGIATAGVLVEQWGLQATLALIAGCYTLVSLAMLRVPAFHELSPPAGASQRLS